MRDSLSSHLPAALHRSFGRDRGLTLAAAMLAVSIGASAAMFSVVNAILLQPLPYPGSGRICWLSERLGRDRGGGNGRRLPQPPTGKNASSRTWPPPRSRPPSSK
jgi:hypothetical protein